MQQQLYCDTHSHINSKEYAEDRAAVVDAAGKAGLAFLIDVATDAESSRAAMEVAAEYPGVFSTVGVHPHEASRYSESELKSLLALHDRPRVVAIGEMGLDYHYDHSPRPKQREIFALQIEFALAHDRPIVVHARDAVDDSITMFAKDFGRFPSGVFHCFAGDYRQAVKILDGGMYLSFGGPVTFKKNEELREMIKKLPLDRMLLETDCPYLTPIPFRGKRNEPKHVTLVAAEVARVKELKVEDVARQTTENARALFGIKECR